MARSPKKPNPTKPKKPSGVRHEVVALGPKNTGQIDLSSPLLRELVSKLPGGLVAVLANESARYTIFQSSCQGLILPNGSRFGFFTGCYVVDSCNTAVASLGKDEDWIMLMGDDHVFSPNLALKLLSLMYRDDLDIIVPVCFRRDFPPTPVLYRYAEAREGSMITPDKYAYNDEVKKYLFPINLNAFPEGGLIEVDGAGSAGMIIRKRVLLKIEPPWFRLGVDQWGEDLDFCRRAQDAGFKIHADLDMSLGHIINTIIWPAQTDKKDWGVQYDHGNKGGYFLEI